MATFLHLLTVQMASQNPLEPMKDSDLFAQISQLGQVQGMQNLQTQGDFTKAQSLIGKVVDAVYQGSGTSGNSVITGTVTGVAVSPDGTVKLNVTQSDGTNSSVGLTSIQNVYEGDTGPKPLPVDYTYLIGKTVGGLNGTTKVAGQATGIEVANGVIVVDVLTSAGVKLQLPVGGITSIT
ncbi:MAG: flagellar hook capping FlgD N-terminal domain-containing protein [Armatimonadota bacterium]